MPVRKISQSRLNKTVKSHPSLSEVSPSEYNKLLYVKTKKYLSAIEFNDLVFESIQLNYFHIFIWLLISFSFQQNLIQLIVWNCISRKRALFVDWILKTFSIQIVSDTQAFALQSGQVEIYNLIKKNRMALKLTTPFAKTSFFKKPNTLSRSLSF